MDAISVNSNNNSPYLLATLQNSTEDPTGSSPVPTTTAHNSAGLPGDSRSFAMIILYVIVGVVSTL